jgi:hypothetical protein
MSDYLKSKDAGNAWEAMRSKFKKPKEEEKKPEESSSNWFTKTVDKVSNSIGGKTAAEVATEQLKKKKEQENK